MKEKIIWSLWAFLYVACVWLGVLGRPDGVGGVFYTLCALIFFMPGGLLLYWGIREKKHKQVRWVRIISAGSLLLTLILLVLNFASVLFSQTAGNVLHTLLVVVSVPMVCSGYWVVSLFLWACLLMVSLMKVKK